jgi:hypothetical protein
VDLPSHLKWFFEVANLGISVPRYGAKMLEILEGREEKSTVMNSISPKVSLPQRRRWPARGRR